MELLGAFPSFSKFQKIPEFSIWKMGAHSSTILDAGDKPLAISCTSNRQRISVNTLLAVSEVPLEGATYVCMSNFTSSNTASAMKRAVPSGEAYAISSDSSCSESEADGSARKKQNSKALVISVKDAVPEGVLVPAIISKADPLTRKAEMYQEYMRTIPIPRYHGSIIPFTSWQGLAKSMKQVYRQPLHYLTNILLKQWDQLRAGAENEQLRLDTIIHPAKAESLIWVTEEVHRLTCSPHHLANLWDSDPMYHAFIDSVFSDMAAIAGETHV